MQRRIDRYGVSKKSVFVIHMLPSLGRNETSLLFTAQRKEASIALPKKLDFFDSLQTSQEGALKPWLGTSAGFIRAFRIKPTSEGTRHMNPGMYTLCRLFLLPRCYCAEERKAEINLECGMVLRATYAHLSLRCHICVWRLLLKYCSSHSSS